MGNILDGGWGKQAENQWLGRFFFYGLFQIKNHWKWEYSTFPSEFFSCFLIVLFNHKKYMGKKKEEKKKEKQQKMFGFFGKSKKL